MTVDDQKSREMSEKSLEDAPVEMVMELNPDGDGYRAVQPLVASESPNDTTEKQCDGDVRVVQTPVAFTIELRLSPQGETGYTVSRRYVPWQAEKIVTQIRSGDAPKLANKLGDQQAKDIADDMSRARNIVATESISERVGQDVVETFQNGKISNEELAHEIEQQIEFEMDRRDG